jgi:hypothetical protein
LERVGRTNVLVESRTPVFTGPEHIAIDDVVVTKRPSGGRDLINDGLVLVGIGHEHTSMTKHRERFNLRGSSVRLHSGVDSYGETDVGQ